MTSTTTSQPAPIAGWLTATRRPLSAMIATNFVSLFSNQLTAIAVPWFVLTLTGSATQTGLTAAVTILPSVVMSIFGGALVDRMSARRMSIFSDLLSGVTVALVPLLYLLDLLNFPLLLLLMFLGAIFDTPGSTARATMLPELSKRANVPLERVNGVFGINQALTTLFGAAIAGVMIGSFGAVNALWLNAVAFGVSALVMVTLVPELGVRPESGSTLVSDMREGLGWLWRQAGLRTIIFAAVVINAIFAPLTAVVLPYFAKTEFDSAPALGFIMSAFGGGALLGAFSYSTFAPKFGKRTQVMTSVCLISLPITGMILLPPVWVACMLMLLVGIGVGAVNPLVSTVIMTTAPQHMLGRVSGVFMAAAMVASPVGVLIAGPLIATAGLRGTFILFSAILVLVWLGLLLSRSLHQLDDAAAQTDAQGVFHLR